MTIREMTEVYNINNMVRLSPAEFLEWCFAVGVSYIDKRLDLESFYHVIVRRAGNLNIYASCVSEFRIYCTIWCKTNQYYITKLLDTMEFEYNPIHNYDRHEEGTNHNKQTRDLNRPFSENQNDSTSAYNTDSFKPTDRTERGGHQGEEGTVDDDGRYGNYMYGNIGVTTTQEMIKAERDVVNFSALEVLAQSFVDDNFLKVW